MAEFLLSSLANAIIETLNSGAVEEFGIISGLKTEFENLQSTLTMIQAVVQDAEAKQWQSKAVKIWLEKLKDAAFDAEDAIDEFATEAQRRKIESGISTFFSLQNPLVFRVKMAHRLKSIRERLDGISAEKSKFNLKEGVADIEVNRMEGRQTSSFVIESEICGRDDEIEKIVGALFADLPDQDAVATYGIWGMGGLGKTTLAQYVYKDERVQRHFEMRIWVCVSVDFEVRRLTKAIIESIGGSASDISELDPLQQRLREKIGGKKFLLVLDDVWNEENDKWDGLKAALRYGEKGSMVIVTTRSEKIALQMATPTLPVHHIGILTEDDSWSLFKRRAFGNGRSEVNSDLESIGKDIVKKCGGVPLAIKALGGLMRLKSTESEWKSVKDSEIWDLGDAESGILSSLKLSYDHLPSHLKQCFAYCCVFPKDSVMKREELIRLWMANGFIPSKGQIDLHDMGLQIFNELVWRSFFQDIREPDFKHYIPDDVRDGIPSITCKMHDLMHDVAESIMGSTIQLIKPIVNSTVQSMEVTKISKQTRHINWDAWTKFDIIFKTRSLRSCIQFDCRILSKQKYLRVLNSEAGSSKELSILIGRFKHLRYLNLAFSVMEVLPESISCLPNLQTLILRYSPNLRKLPESMKHLRNLTYLDLRDCDSLTCMAPKMGELTCLRLLSLFIIGKDNGHQIEELEGLNLGGELSLKGLGNVQNSTEAKKANLMGKPDLQSLSLYWEEEKDVLSMENAEDVLAALQPHPNLKNLDIFDYPGTEFPNWMMDLYLQNVVRIGLYRCKRCERLPALGNLSSLKALYIHGMDAVRCFDESSGDMSFPALERLRIMGMRNLEHWGTVNRRESFPCLTELCISNCPKLVDFPALLLSLKELEIWGGNVMLLSSVKNVTSLTSLTLANSNDLTLLPDEMLKNHSLLTRLHIIFFENLKSFGNQLDNLSALKTLDLFSCPKLESLPEGLQNLKSLESLYIKECNSLVSFHINGLRGLSSLRWLFVGNCEKLASFSNGMQYLTALENLTIEKCPEVNSLLEDIHHLTALRRLTIRDCRELSSLPETIGCLVNLSQLGIYHCINLESLPEALKSLTAMEILEIIGGCPRLKRRCKKDRGEDWPKIAHIPTIQIWNC